MARIHWLGLLIAPFTLPARARGWRRPALLAAYGLAAAAIGLPVAREVRLREIPDVPDPVDRAAAGRVALPDAANAMVPYRRALDRLKGPGSQAERDRDALASWREGARCPDAVLVQPASLADGSPVARYQELFDLCPLVDRELDRRRALADPDGDWEVHLAAVRTALHAGRHGGADAAVASAGLLRWAGTRVATWARAPGATPARLRRALADLDGLAALVPPLAETVAVQSFSRRAALRREGAAPSASTLFRVVIDSDPINLVPGMTQFRLFWADEPRRSLRLDSAILAGQLAHCDLPPPLDRPAFGRFGIYAVDARTPPRVAAIPPATLAALAEDSNLMIREGEFERMRGDHRAITGLLRRTLPVRLAVAADRLDHPDRPARSIRDLVGPYLAAPPPGPDRFDGDGP